MRTIQKIEVFPIRLPVIAAFTFSSGSAGAVGEGAPFVLVKMTDSEGEVGWGEGRPSPQWSYETLETVATTIRGYLAPAVIGHPVTDMWGLHRRMHAVIGRGPSTGQPIAKAAVDMAAYDLCARAAGLPLRCFVGGSAERRNVALSYTLTAHDIESLRQQISAAQESRYRHFNFKVAVEHETDIEIAREVRSAAGPNVFVWADANQGLSPTHATSTAVGLESAGVDVLEQPLPADQPNLMRRLRQACSIPLAVDESSVSPADFFLYASEGLVDYLVIKLTRSGGIWPTLQQISVAASAGLPLLVSGLTDGMLTKLAACQVASAFGFEGPAALNGSQFIDDSELYPEKARYESGGTVRLGDEPGIGIRPDEEALKHFAAEL